MKKAISLAILVLCIYQIKAQTATTIYQQFKDNQFKFPKPQQVDTIDVGAFNFLYGTFTGIQSAEIESPVKPAVGAPRARLWYNVQSQSPKHMLKFKIINYTMPFTVRVNGTIFESTQGQSELFIPVQGPVQGDKEIG